MIVVDASALLELLLRTPAASAVDDAANFTACDAGYVALAEALDAVLVTRDRRLAAAPGIRARIQCL